MAVREPGDVAVLLSSFQAKETPVGVVQLEQPWQPRFNMSIEGIMSVLSCAFQRETFKHSENLLKDEESTASHRMLCCCFLLSYRSLFL